MESSTSTSYPDNTTQPDQHFQRSLATFQDLFSTNEFDVAIYMAGRPPLSALSLQQLLALPRVHGGPAPDAQAGAGTAGMMPANETVAGNNNPGANAGYTMGAAENAPTEPDMFAGIDPQLLELPTQEWLAPAPPVPTGLALPSRPGLAVAPPAPTGLALPPRPSRVVTQADANAQAYDDPTLPALNFEDTNEYSDLFSMDMPEFDAWLGSAGAQPAGAQDPWNNMGPYPPQQQLANSGLPSGAFVPPATTPFEQWGMPPTSTQPGDAPPQPLDMRAPDPYAQPGLESAPEDYDLPCAGEFTNNTDPERDASHQLRDDERGLACTTCKRAARYRVPGGDPVCPRHYDSWIRESSEPPTFTIVPGVAFEITMFPRFERDARWRELSDPAAQKAWEADFEAHWMRRLLDAVSTPIADKASFEWEQQKVLSGKARMEKNGRYSPRHITAHVAALVRTALNFHAGRRRVYPMGGDSWGYGAPDKLLTLHARLEAIEGILRIDKLVASDVLEGRGMNGLVISPAKYHKRKQQNKKSNVRKAEAEGEGRPKKRRKRGRGAAAAAVDGTEDGGADSTDATPMDEAALFGEAAAFDGQASFGGEVAPWDGQAPFGGQVPYGGAIDSDGGDPFAFGGTAPYGAADPFAFGGQVPFGGNGQ